MSFLDELRKRGMLNNITNEEKFDSLSEGAGVYIGFDPSADSLHLGNYVQIATLKRFEKAGFKPVALIGGATGMIGDPSGKKAERTLLDVEKVNANKKAIKAQLKSFDLDTFDNLDNYKNMSILDFLRDVGKHLNVNYMIQKDIVKSRLETGISFTEFSYQLIQGWDFKRLYEDNGVRIQVGGSDQWGNITAGVEIIRKEFGDDNQAVGMTTNLLLNSSGAKFGKSVDGALFIDSNKTSPFAIYQYLYNTKDSDLKTYMMWLLFETPEWIEETLELHKSEPAARKAQWQLAYNVVKDIHGDKIAKQCDEITQALFGGHDITSLSLEQIKQLESVIPFTESKEDNVLDLLVKATAASSKREAREFIQSGAVHINGEVIASEDHIVKTSEFFDGKYSIIKRGKRKYFLIKH